MKFAVFFILCTVSPLFAQTKDINRCHAMKGSDNRLICYDLVTGYTALEPDDTAEGASKTVETVPTAELPVVSPSGKQWRYSDEKSALEERKDVWLSVISQNTEGNSIGSPIHATLWVRCMENSTNLFIGFDRYTTDDQNVKYKLDDGSIRKQWMETMRGGDGIGVWSGSRAIPFIKRLLGKDKMVVAYDTYSGPVEFVFDVSGLSERIGPLSTACQWKP